ncbi:D-alanine--D-alanine ligase [Streptomyces sp. NPDC050617]|uniref:D-alanine--D-alanine ligase family protein n=1 Tax=Streptomyces sp. NPDC050617 TaxID=3154628 RepID=UPI0034199206
MSTTATTVTTAATAARPLTVAVIGGGQNCEHDVSLATAAAIRDALPAPYTALALTIGPDGAWRGPDDQRLPGGLTDALALLATCDLVFPAVHGPRGEDGTLAALCDLADLPYVGSGVRAGALAMDKATTKLIAQNLGIPVARSALATAATLATPAEATAPLPLPVVVKPAAAGSSHGVTRVDTPGDYSAALAAALALDSRVLVEEHIDGREIDIAVLRRADQTLLVSPPLEIATEGRLFDTTLKYDGTAAFRIPAPLSRAEHDTLTRHATRLFDTLGCAGTARFDFFLTSSGFVLNEVNTTPGLTTHSQVPKMFAAAGLDYPRLLTELITSALATHATP